MTAAAALAALGVLVAGSAIGRPSGRGRSDGARASRRAPSPPDTDAWAAFLTTAAAEVRGGSSLSAAVAAATARHRPAGAAVHEGVTLAELAQRSSADPDEAVVLQTVDAAHTLGGPVAATLDSGAALLRERAAVRAEAQVHSAQARLSARVLTAVPLVFAAWSLATSASFRRAVLGGPGVAIAAIGAALNLAGWWWMRRTIERVAR